VDVCACMYECESVYRLGSRAGYEWVVTGQGGEGGGGGCESGRGSFCPPTRSSSSSSLLNSFSRSASGSTPSSPPSSADLNSPTPSPSSSSSSSTSPVLSSWSHTANTTPPLQGEATPDSHPALVDGQASKPPLAISSRCRYRACITEWCKDVTRRGGGGGTGQRGKRCGQGCPPALAQHTHPIPQNCVAPCVPRCAPARPPPPVAPASASPGKPSLYEIATSGNDSWG
jgi:hypothetical protein